MRRGLRIVWRGIRDEPGMFSIAVAGSAVYGIGTAGAGWVLGRLVENVLAPAFAARSITAGQMAFAVGSLALVARADGRRRRGQAGRRRRHHVPAQARYRRAVTRQYLRLPLSWHHRHPPGSCCPTRTPTSRPPGWYGAAADGARRRRHARLGRRGDGRADPLLGSVGLLVVPAVIALNVVFQRRMSPAGGARPAAARRASPGWRTRASRAPWSSRRSGARPPRPSASGRCRHELRDANIAVGDTRGLFDPLHRGDARARHARRARRRHAARIAAGEATTGDVVQVAYLLVARGVPGAGARLGARRAAPRASSAGSGSTPCCDGTRRDDLRRPPRPPATAPPGCGWTASATPTTGAGRRAPPGPARRHPRPAAPGAPSRSSGPPAPASRRSPACSSAWSTPSTAPCCSTASTCARCARGEVAAGVGARAAEHLHLRRHRPRQRHAGARTSPTPSVERALAVARAGGLRGRAARRASTPASASAAPRCAAGSASASRWPAPWSAGPGCSCSTTRRPRSTRTSRRASSRACARRARTRPWSSSPTGWRRSRWPTRWCTSSAAGSSARGTHDRAHAQQPRLPAARHRLRARRRGTRADPRPGRPNPPRNARGRRDRDRDARAGNGPLSAGGTTSTAARVPDPCCAGAWRSAPSWPAGLPLTLLLALLSTAGRVLVPVAVQQTIDHGIRGAGGPRPGLVLRR